MSEARPRYRFAGETLKTTMGDEFIAEDWAENVLGCPWYCANGNPAALLYAVHAAEMQLPIDNEVVYGKICGLGYLLHISELIVPEEAETA